MPVRSLAQQLKNAATATHGAAWSVFLSVCLSVCLSVGHVREAFKNGSFSVLKILRGTTETSPLYILPTVGLCQYENRPNTPVFILRLSRYAEATDFKLRKGVYQKLLAAGLPGVFWDSLQELSLQCGLPVTDASIETVSQKQIPRHEF